MVSTSPHNFSIAVVEVYVILIHCPRCALVLLRERLFRLIFFITHDFPRCPIISLLLLVSFFALNSSSWATFISVAPHWKNHFLSTFNTGSTFIVTSCLLVFFCPIFVQALLQTAVPLCRVRFSLGRKIGFLYILS